jgi:hypothetical protein
MSVGKLIGGLLGGVAGLVLSKPKKPPTPLVQQPVQMRVNSAAADALQARSGSRANRRTGARGAEYSGGVKTKLGQ